MSMNVKAVERMTARELGAMTREEVAGMSVAARKLRRELMLADETPCNLNKIQKLSGLGRDAVARWRSNYLRTGKAAINALPAPMNEEDCDLPAGHPNKAKEGHASPLWPTRQILEWLAWSERVDKADLLPVPGGRKTGPVASIRDVAPKVGKKSGSKAA